MILLNNKMSNITKIVPVQFYHDDIKTYNLQIANRTDRKNFKTILYNCNINNENNEQFQSIDLYGNNDFDINYVNNELVIQFSNNGVEFNPLEEEVNYIEEYSEDLEMGGLGLTIIKNFASDLKYERKDGFNYLTMTIKK